jgi:ADP-heptose:LPS heptosyltransferase
MHGVRSLLKLCWLVMRESALTAYALLRADFPLAGIHFRILATSIHEDLLQIVVALQRRLPLWRLPSRDIERILIVKLDRIGDMVTTTPVFDALHALFPRASLDIVGHPVPLSLLEGDERIRERIPYRSWLYHPLLILPGGPRAWWLVLRLLGRRYSLVVYLRGTFAFLPLGLFSRLAAAKFVPGEPVIDRYLKPLEPFGPIVNRQPRVHVRAGSAAAMRKLLAEGVSGPSVVVHASASSATKIWPAERYAALADRLAEELNARVHFLGNQTDETWLDAIAGRAAHGHAYHSSLRLPEVAALIQACDLFIGNDSGLAHIAAGVGTRMVVLWGPVNLSMARPTAPPQRCTILYHDLPCRAQCPEFRCINPVHLECLLRTDVDMVLDAARRMLSVATDRNGKLSSSAEQAAAISRDQA